MAFFPSSAPHVSRNSEHVRVWHPVSRSRHWCACPHVRHLISRNPAHRDSVLPFLIAAHIAQFGARAGLAPSVAQPTLVCLSPCAAPHLAEPRSSGSRSSLALLRTYRAIRSTCGSGTQCRAADTGVPVPTCVTSSRGAPLIRAAFFPCSASHIGTGTLVRASPHSVPVPYVLRVDAALGTSPICASGFIPHSFPCSLHGLRTYSLPSARKSSGRQLPLSASDAKHSSAPPSAVI